MTLDIILIIGTILLLSSFIKGVTGFGTALFAMPILTTFYLSPEEARPLIVTINLLLNVYILTSEKKLNIQELKPLSSLVIAGFIAALLSGFILASMNPFVFNLLLGSLLIFTAINKLFQLNFNIKHPKRYYIPMGSIGGILNTLIGAGGVPVLIFLSNTKLKKEEFRLSILLFFFTMNVGSILAFIINQTYPLTTLYSVLMVLPFVVIGAFLGMKAVPHLNDKIFQRVVSVLLLLMGINSIINLF
ncbi:sulfite exporter TauE/SafE family protein [Liberiplasma polymorphum]|uniref:sulfite exporter TauE/SafE family protein n=1 Tax=Liberiplasma polymorphum TaxID=3374570 RepID=UPI0037737FB9